MSKFVRTGLLLSALFAGLVFGGQHLFSVHDMLAMQRISDVQVSGDGGRIVFSLGTVDLEKNKVPTDLWLVKPDGTDLMQLTSNPASDFNCRFSVDSTAVYFLSGRSGSSQLWKISLTGGEAIQVTSLPLDITGFAVSPDGKKLAITMDVFPNMNTPEKTAAELDRRAKQKASGVIYDSIPVRHWDTFDDGRKSHIFILDLGKPNECADLMGGMDADCPSKPFGGTEEYTFTPDGKEIVFTCKDVGKEDAWSTDFDLYRVAVDGSAKPVCLTETNKAWDTSAVFSPDGKTMAYLAMETPGYESDRFRIILREYPAGSERVLTESWDRSPSGMVFSPDGKTIYATAANLGQRSLFAIDVAAGTVETIVHQGSISVAGVSGEKIIFALDNIKSPAEIYSVVPEGKVPQAITKINARQVAEAQMGDYEQFTFKGYNDEDVYCYIVKPVGFEESRSYPAAFLIHGGPQGSFGNTFHYRWNPQAYAGAGYAAIMVDFHGSTGYGQAFCDSIRGDWGGKPLEDLKKGLAAATAKYTWIDPDRVCGLGGSYGGFMVNWIAGNWPDRFKCLVNHDGNIDERFAYLGTEELWFPEHDHGGTPWENPQGYEKHNPVNFIKNWKTPMLVIHGQLDYRVTVTQGLGTFNALQRKGIPSKLLYFPDENHWVVKPQNSIQWYDTVISWIDQWTKK